MRSNLAMCVGATRVLAPRPLVTVRGPPLVTAVACVDRLNPQPKADMEHLGGSARRSSRQSFIFSGAPIAFQPECPLFMYFASKPDSRNLIAVLQPT